MRTGSVAQELAVAVAPRAVRVTGRAWPAEDRLEAVKALMLKLAAGQRFERLGAIVQEHLFTGGKRLRARLALSACDALNVPESASVPWAAACELLHNATLIHDDLQDGDKVRRGHFAVWVRHGQAQAINAGDLLLMLPYVALEHVEVEAGVRWHLAQAIARRAEQTVRGQSLEMCLLHGGMLDWAHYADASIGKTSALMTLPAHGAALIAGRSPEQAAALADRFQNLGLLFQVQDDVLDLFGDKGRESRGGDVREGKVSALVVEHLRLHPEDHKWLIGILATPREDTSEREVETVARAFEQKGALEAVLGRLRSLAQETANDPLLMGEPALRTVALELVERSLLPVRHLMGA